MIEVKHYGSGERTRIYECTPKREIELCLANIECLLNIALLDSDEHIREMGGEQELLNLMNGYLNLAYRFMGIAVEPQERKPYVPEINVGKMSEIPTGSESEG